MVGFLLIVMPSPGLNESTTNGPAPTGFRPKAHSRIALDGSVHTRLSSVGDGIIPTSSDSANWKDAHGSLSVTRTVSGSTTVTSLTVVM